MRYRRLGDSGLPSPWWIGCNNFGRQAGRRRDRGPWSTPRSTPASRSSTPPTSTAPRGQLGGAARRGAGQAGATTSSSPPSSACDMRRRQRAGLRRARLPPLHPRAVEASLRRLGTDYIDLYQLHRPTRRPRSRRRSPPWTTSSRAGKVRYIGRSNFAGWQIADAAWTAQPAHLTPFVSAQNDYSLLDRDVEARDGAGLRALRRRPAAVLPARHGLLTGKYRRGETRAGRQPAGAATLRRLLAEAPLGPRSSARGVRRGARRRPARGRHRRPGRPAGGHLVIAGATSPSRSRPTSRPDPGSPPPEDQAAIDGRAHSLISAYERPGRRFREPPVRSFVTPKEARGRDVLTARSRPG